MLGRFVVVDAHVHGPHFVPQPWRALYRLVNRTTMPADVGFSVLGRAGVDLAVAKAVGDPVVTRWYRGGPWPAVVAQLDQFVAEAAAAGVAVVDGGDGVDGGGGPSIVLGVEGLDCIGSDLDRLDDLRRRGVRVAVPVDLGDNQIGSTCLPWQRYVGPLPVGRRRAPGLTAFGRSVIGRMQGLGIVVDVAHMDSATLAGVVAVASRPVIASHSGARACQDFARYLTDDEARAVASTGGVIGPWPYRHRGHGIDDVADLVRHARHLASVAGPDHLCLGTDMNGVPGVMAGYRDETDLAVVLDALLAGGFSDAEVEGIAGRNFLRVLAASAGR